MKKYCKNIDITDRELISRAVYKCLEGKYKRNDTIRLFAEESGLEENQIRCILYRYGEAAVRCIVGHIVTTIRAEILNQSLRLIPIWYKEKVDPSSGKVRRIGIQDIKQQMYDYIAVEGLRPILRRIGEHQYASIKGKGPLKGARQIKRWLRNRSIKYVGKADIRKCFESISQEKLMEFLRQRIKNNNLLWLIKTLISTFEKGLSIGSYLSQYLCNLYMSQLYHDIKEHMYRIRKHRNGNVERIGLVKKALFYMDDILLLGTNAKDLHKAMDLIHTCAEKMGLKIKESWVVYKYNDKVSAFIDMMGFRIYRKRIAIRRCVFKRIRRAYMRALRKIKTHQKIPVSLARRCQSYWGTIKNTDSYKVKQKYKVAQVRRICRKVVSRNDKSKVFAGAGACPCAA